MFEQYQQKEPSKMAPGERLEWASRLIKHSLDGQRLLTIQLPNGAKSMLEETLARFAELAGELCKGTAAE